MKMSVNQSDRVLLAEYGTYLVSEANSRDGWRKKASRTKKHKEDAFFITKALLAHAPSLKLAPPFRITITRIGVRNLDGDNLQGSAKATRDGIAKAIGIDDGDDRLDWRYAQEHGDYAVRIKIEAQ